MSADLLREAAAKIRTEWAPEDLSGVRARAEAARIHLAVADWLDDASIYAEECGAADAQALTVARAYLGRES